MHNITEAKKSLKNKLPCGNLSFLFRIVLPLCFFSLVVICAKITKGMELFSFIPFYFFMV